MKRLLTIMLCFSMILSLSACGDSQSFYGSWKVDRQLENAPMGDMGDGDLETILASRLDFSKESASCFGDAMDSLGTTVDNPEYISSDVPKEDFERMTGTTFDALGISGNSVRMIVVISDPTVNSGIVFYVVNKDTLLTNSVGTFFVLTRAN